MKQVLNKCLIRKKVFDFLGKYGDNVSTKFSNVCSKTGSYSVPLELFQKRTPRKNRSLISWRAVQENGLTLKQLKTFEGGVVVDFINNDIFEKKYNNNPLFIELLNRLGCDEKVSSIISIRAENGSSSSSIPRQAFSKLTNNTNLVYNSSKISITKDNFQKFSIQQTVKRQGQGNNTWKGFLFVSICGGQQDTIETHKDKELTLFNPACEYASSDVCEDINLVLAYYALFSIPNNDPRKNERDIFIKTIEEVLKNTRYNFKLYKGNLYDYVKKHYSISIVKSQLTDAIQLNKIDINKFNITARNPDSIDLTHNEAVVYERYYWDAEKECVLSAARPTNLFWSYHLSNMMQQNFSLNEYFKYEEKRFKIRQEMISKIKA